LIEFDEQAKEKEKKFEEEFNHDIDELAKALKGFFKEDVK